MMALTDLTTTVIVQKIEFYRFAANFTFLIH